MKRAKWFQWLPVSATGWRQSCQSLFQKSNGSNINICSFSIETMGCILGVL